MTLQVADTLEVRRWILGYGSEAEALARKLAPLRMAPASLSAHLRETRSQYPRSLG